METEEEKEKMKKEKYKILRVTSTEDYILEMIDDKRTYINGWTIKEVIEDWFKRFSMGGHHATREGSVIGNSRKYVSSEIIKMKEKKSMNEKGICFIEIVLVMAIISVFTFGLFQHFF